MSVHQLTIRGLDDELERRLRALARARGLSLNKAALELMRRGAGLDTEDSGHDIVGSSLDHLIGTWSDQEAHEFLTSIQDLERIDDSMWS